MKHNWLKTELYKLMTAPSFWGGILLVTILCTTSDVYYDYANGKAFTVLEVLMPENSHIREEVGFYSVMTKTLSNSYATLFIPIAACMGYVPLMCIERASGALRFQIIRQGRLAYLVNKVVSAMICGGLTVLFGYLLFMGFAWCIFSGDNSEEYELLTASPLSYYIRSCIGTFLVGAASIFPSLILCAICSDKYIILCIPVLYSFLLNTAENFITVQKLRLHFIYFQASGASLIINRFSWPDLGIVLIFPIISIAVFYSRIKKKVDCGE